jgi:hypothetical protein
MRNESILPGLLIIAVYFLPSIIAILRSARWRSEVILGNIFLGWMILPWFYFLYKSFNDD